jgi:uncharacterized protein DUF1707
MAGPGDEIAAGAGGRGHLRASHADRERVTEILKVAFVQGRLGRDEFDLRVGQALASRTYAELAALTADIPAGLTAAPPPKPANAQARPPVKKIVIACGWVVPRQPWWWLLSLPIVTLRAPWLSRSCSCISLWG